MHYFKGISEGVTVFKPQTTFGRSLCSREVRIVKDCSQKASLFRGTRYRLVLLSVSF